LLVAGVTLAAVAGCTPDLPADRGRGPLSPASFPAGSTMRRLHDLGKLTVGVDFDEPNIGLLNPATGLPEGFDVELAKIVATGLGLRSDQIDFVATVPGDREPYLVKHSVDLVIATYSITDARRKVVSFAGPYFQTGQDLLVRRDEPRVTGPDDLAGHRVCVPTGTTSLANIQRNYPMIVLVPKASHEQCVNALLRHSVDAVTTDGAILLGYAAREPSQLRVVGNPFSVELYGIGLAHGDTQFRYFLDDVLQDAINDGRWRKAYDTTLGRGGAMPPTPPIVYRY
jgi:glutamate transport system substrate-binding protein